MTEIVADKTVEVVKNAIETADGALDLYNKYLDQVIPWQTFDETIKELSRFKQEYSQAASVLVGDIKTLLMDSQDKYFEATQTVYGMVWCCPTLHAAPPILRTTATSAPAVRCCLRFYARSFDYVQLSFTMRSHPSSISPRHPPRTEYESSGASYA